MDRPASDARGRESFSERFARFTVGFRLEQAPAAMDVFRTALIDSIGVMLAGSREAPALIAREIVKAEDTGGAASIIGDSRHTSVQLAAFANGVANHAMDYDFSFAIGQSASPVLPALLAVAADENATVADLAEAFIVGLELASRLARAVPKLSSGAGWQAAGTIGPVAAALAVAKLRKLPLAAIPDVIGIACSMAAGLGVNYGTMTKPLHVGQSARNAILAAALGERGFTASANALEGRAGFIDLFSPPNPLPDGFLDDLGTRLDALERGITLKLYPCGGLLHTGIEAALALRAKLPPDRIAQLHVGVTSRASKRARSHYPATVEAAKFSMQYVVAYALLRGAPMVEAFTDAALEDDGVRAFVDRISVAVDGEFGASGNDINPARVTATTTDGETVEAVCLHSSGKPQKLLSAAQMKEKFMSCAVHALDRESSLALFEWLSSLDPRSSFAPLWPLLRK